MCGITGFISVKGVQEADIDRMNHAVRHRGPDDKGIFINRKKTAGLGHQRLSIIDLDSGHQPMSDEDDTIWITFNGEIYNYQELREDLGRRHQFKTKSDTEVILHLYKEKGEDCVKDLRGMFAFAIYNQENNKLFLARDHLGQKPLYYYHQDNEFAFASEIKALLALKPELRELSPEALHEYLTLRIITPPRSMFKRIQKLPPGHILVFHKDRINIQRYWNLKYKPKIKSDLPEILMELKNHLESTVKYHLVSDVPVGAFLSGGMDSSLIVALMSQFVSEPIMTFSGDVPYENYSELPYARMIATANQTNHHELTIKPSLIRTLPDLVWHLDEPSDPLSVCIYTLSKLTRRHVKVVLGGDGGDELFGGYDRYYGNVLVNYYAMLPDKIRRKAITNILNRMPDGFWYKSLSHKLKWIHQLSFYHNSVRYSKSLSYFYFSDSYRSKLYTERFIRDVSQFDPEESIKNYFECDNADQVIDKMLYTDSMLRMPDHPVMILDRMTMAHGLEARSPFLDHKLTEFCARIPSHFKIKRTRLRYIQVELAKKYLPPELIKKKKQGFSSALPYLLDFEFKRIFKSLLFNSSLVRDGYLRHSAIQHLLNTHLAKKQDHGVRLWLLCNAEVWYRMYIDNIDRSAISDLLIKDQ